MVDSVQKTSPTGSILACLDGSSHSQAVCDYSTWIAKSLDAPLKLLHTIEHASTAHSTDLSGAIGLGASQDLLNELIAVEADRSRLLVKKGNLMLKAAQQKALGANVENVSVCLQHSSLNETLIETEDDTRVLVIGISGEGQDKKDQKAISAKLESVVRSLHKPILVVNGEFNAPKKIMLAYNGSDESKKALHMIASSPLFSGIECHIVHAAPESASNKTEVLLLLNEAVSALANTTIKVISAQLNDDNIHNAFSDYQSKYDIDLLVMGAFGHNRVRHFLLGSFTAKMLQQTQKPLLLLR